MERDVLARVVTLPFYDPDGTRLKGGDWSPPSAAPPPLARPPTKVSAFHNRLRATGAAMVEVDSWQQADRIGGANDEARRAREGIGVLDVSPLQKLALKGTDVGDVLARLCGDSPAPGLGQVARTDVGGNACVIARVADDEALLLAPASAREPLEAAVSSAIGTGDGCHHLVDLTSTLAGLRLVGPRCRDVLGKLTSADLRDRFVPSGSCAQVGLARIPALIVRLDLAGLPGYEVYVSRDYGEYAWDVLFDAGREFGIALVGLSAWRTLSQEA